MAVYYAYDPGFGPFLSHHGKEGMHWGVKHGPPYPLDRDASGRPPATKSINKSKMSPETEEKYSKKKTQPKESVEVIKRDRKGRDKRKMWEKSDDDVRKEIERMRLEQEYLAERQRLNSMRESTRDPREVRRQEMRSKVAEAAIELGKNYITAAINKKFNLNLKAPEKKDQNNQNGQGNQNKNNQPPVASREDRRRSHFDVTAENFIGTPEEKRQFLEREKKRALDEQADVSAAIAREYQRAIEDSMTQQQQEGRRDKQQRKLERQALKGLSISGRMKFKRQMRNRRAAELRERLTNPENGQEQQSQQNQSRQQQQQSQQNQSRQQQQQSQQNQSRQQQQQQQSQQNQSRQQQQQQQSQQNQSRQQQQQQQSQRAEARGIEYDRNNPTSFREEYNAAQRRAASGFENWRSSRNSASSSGSSSIDSFLDWANANPGPLSTRSTGATSSGRDAVDDWLERNGF